MPNFSAMLLSAAGPRFMPILPKVVSQDWANAVISGAWPLPSPQTSPLLLVSTWVVCGSVSWVGESTFVLLVVLGLWVSRAALVTILKVEPGARVSWRARLDNGLPGALSSAASLLLSCVPSCTARRAGL